MGISKTFRYSAAICITIQVLMSLYTTSLQSIDSSVLVRAHPIFVSFEILVASLVLFLMGSYFYRKGWKFPFSTVIALDLFQIFILVLILVKPDFDVIYPNYYSAIMLLYGLLFYPLFNISLLVSGSKKHTWLKIYGYSFFVVFVATIFSMIYASLAVSDGLSYVFVLTNLFLVAHFLFPDYQIKGDDELIDNSL